MELQTFESEENLSVSEDLKTVSATKSKKFINTNVYAEVVLCLFMQSNLGIQNAEKWLQNSKGEFFPHAIQPVINQRENKGIFRNVICFSSTF